MFHSNVANRKHRHSSFCLVYSKRSRILVWEQFINPLANRVKVAIFTAKYALSSNVIKKMDSNFFGIFVNFADQNFDDSFSSEIKTILSLFFYETLWHSQIWAYSAVFIYDGTHYRFQSQIWANLLNRIVFVCQNNEGYAPFEYHVKNVPAQWKPRQNSQQNHVLSNNQFLKWSPGL